MRKGGYIILLAGLAIVALVFSQGITDSHLSMDDWGYTYGCPFVRDGLTLSNLRQSFVEIGYGAFWMPFTYMTYMCDIAFWGGGWPVHHAVNVVLHVLNTLLVVLLLRMILIVSCNADGRQALMLAVIGALVWGVHPMRAEAVTYVASRKELLWSLFTLVGLLAWAQYISSKRRMHYCIAVLCFLLACLSKLTAVCFPALAYLLEVILSKRWFVRGLFRYVPFLFISFVMGCVVLYAEANPIGQEQLDVFGETFSWRLLNACVGFGMYLWHTIMPMQVHLDYRAVFGGRPLNAGLGLSALTLSVLMLAALLYGFRRDKDGCRALMALYLWFFVALLPVSGIIGMVNGDHAYADRYSYLPLIGLVAICAVLATHCTGRALKTFAVLVGAAMICEAWIASDVVRSFKNDYTAFSRTLRKDPDHWRALRIVGNEYCARLGRLDDGVQMLERSLALRPSQRTAESLAYILAIRGASGDFARVRELCVGCVKNPSKDQHGMMLDALGTVCFREGKDVDAVGFYAASLKADMRNYSQDHTMLNLALVLANCGHKRESILLLDRLSKSKSSGVHACCVRLLYQLRAGVSARFEWNPDPFVLRHDS